MTHGRRDFSSARVLAADGYDITDADAEQARAIVLDGLREIPRFG